MIRPEKYYYIRDPTDQIKFITKTNKRNCDYDQNSTEINVYKIDIFYI